jgi:hypothetical protein
VAAGVTADARWGEGESEGRGAEEEGSTGGAARPGSTGTLGAARGELARGSPPAVPALPGLQAGASNSPTGLSPPWW